MKTIPSVALALALSLVPAASAWAQQTADQNGFYFGGRLSADYFEYSFLPFSTNYENNYVVGAGYQQFFFGFDRGLKLGGELGAALRFGDGTSSELWAGPVLRADKFLQTDLLNVSASVTTGLSVTSGTIGVEAARERETGGDTTLLFYLGPEISVSPANHPEIEFFWRVHHRSGAWRTLGNMQDGANANVLGVRHQF